MKRLLHFSVEAIPRTKGSLDAQRMGRTGKIRMVENVDPEGIFRTAVATSAWTAKTGRFCDVTHYRHIVKDGNPFLGCIETRMKFLLPRPSSIRIGDPVWWAPGQQRSGDIEKLVRNVHDALMDAGVIADDSQVTTTGRVVKRFAAPDVLIEPGVLVWVYEDTEADALAEDERWFR